MSFDSATMETLKNIPFEVETIDRSYTMPNIHVISAEKKITRANIQVKNKKPRYYYPLGVYSVSLLDKSVNSDM